MEYMGIESARDYCTLVKKFGFEEFILNYFIDEDSGQCPSVLKNIEGFENFIHFDHKDCQMCSFCGEEDLQYIDEFGDEEAEERKERFLQCHERCYNTLNFVFKKSNKEKY